MNFNYGGLDFEYSNIDEANSIIENLAATGGTIGAIGIVISLISFISMWKIYKKLDKPGWTILVPIYNIWVLLEAVEMPGWIVLIPVANAIAMMVCYVKIAKKLNKGTGFGIGMIVLPIIFLPILAFSKEKEVVTPSGPDLFAKDPNEGENVNLMTPDPVCTLPDEPVIVKKPEILEEPSLEKQILKAEEEIKPEIIVMSPPKPIIPAEPKEEPVINAFNMQAETIETTEVLDDTPKVETLDTSDIEVLDLDDKNESINN